MGIEIERKYLVRDASWRAAVRDTQRLGQGYLGGERCSVRVRVATCAGERSAWINVKSLALGTTRAEFEYAIPPDDADAMLAAFCTVRVEKLRHRVEYEGMLWEIDEFLGDNAGLVVAEVELERADQGIALPPWAGAEVTHDARYFNLNLVREPFSRWPDRDTLRFRE